MVPCSEYRYSDIVSDTSDTPQLKLVIIYSALLVPHEVTESCLVSTSPCWAPLAAPIQRTADKPVVWASNLSEAFLDGGLKHGFYSRSVLSAMFGRKYRSQESPCLKYTCSKSLKVSVPSFFSLSFAEISIRGSRNDVGKWTCCQAGLNVAGAAKYRKGLKDYQCYGMLPIYLWYQISRNHIAMLLSHPTQTDAHSCAFCIYIYIYIHTYTYTYSPTCIQYTHMYVFIHIYTNVCSYAHIRILLRVHVHIRI